MDKDRRLLQGLHKGWLQSILHQHSQCATGTNVVRRDWLAGLKHAARRVLR